jgi:hypothetical protein
MQKNDWIKIDENEWILFSSFLNFLYRIQKYLEILSTLF